MIREVVVTDIVPIPIPLASENELGLMEQAVPLAGTEQDTVTFEEYPKNGVTARSLIYDAVCPAETVWDGIPRLSRLKSAAKVNATGAELEPV